MLVLFIYFIMNFCFVNFSLMVLPFLRFGQFSLWVFLEDRALFL
jgi:hypothetical protein